MSETIYFARVSNITQKSTLNHQVGEILLY